MAQSIDLSWIVVKDFEKAVRFFTEVVGLKVLTRVDEMGWAELAGHEGGAQLGIAAAGMETTVKPGQNSIMTFTVENLDKSRSEFLKKGVKLVGDVLEVPGHVKMQFFKDHDDNLFQIVEKLS
jgi:predicted enzyme related to lactoylglutathione lyase